MSNTYYRRRYYGRRKTNGSDGTVALLLILALVAYRYGLTYSLAIQVAAMVGVCAVLLIIISKLLQYCWRKRPHLKHRDINSMSGLEFERYVADLLKHRGYTNLKLTEYYDLGIDIIAKKDGVIWGIQVKRSSGIVKAAAVRQVVTALRHYKCDRAMVVTNAYFSQPAIKLARSNNCILITDVKL